MANIARWSWYVLPEKPEDMETIDLAGIPVRDYRRRGAPKVGEVVSNWWENGHDLKVELALDEGVSLGDGNLSIDLRGAPVPLLDALKRADWGTVGERP